MRLCTDKIPAYIPVEVCLRLSNKRKGNWGVAETRRKIQKVLIPQNLVKHFKRTKTAGRNFSVSRLMRDSNCAHKNLQEDELKDSRYGWLIDLSGKGTVDQKFGLPGVNLPASSLNLGEMRRVRLLLISFFQFV